MTKITENDNQNDDLIKKIDLKWRQNDALSGIQNDDIKIGAQNDNAIAQHWVIEIVIYT